MLQVDDGTVCSVPPQWTDAVTPDLEVVMGQGRALFRVVDLLELAVLVTRICQGNACEGPTGCKDNSAAYAKHLMPKSRKIGADSGRCFE